MRSKFDSDRLRPAGDSAQSKRNNILTNIKEIDSSLQTGVTIGSHEIPNSSTNRLIFW
jgi:hypothetical protein